MDTPVLAAAHLQGHLLNHKGTQRSKTRGPRSLQPEPAKTGYTSNQGGRIMSRPPMSRVQIRRYNSSSVVIRSSVRESSATTEAWPCQESPWTTL